jgi:hypothetical protein
MSNLERRPQYMWPGVALLEQEVPFFLGPKLTFRNDSGFRTLHSMSRLPETGARSGRGLETPG